MKTEFLRLRLFFTHRGLLKALVIKSFKQRYANTGLGVFWAVVGPFLISLVIAFVFTYIMPSRAENFVIYVISGMFPWICFSSSLQESLTALIDNASLHKQFTIPLEFIPIIPVFINFFTLAIGLVVAIFFSFFFLPVGASLSFFLIPVPLILHFIFTLGIAFLLAPLYLKYRDTRYLLNIFLLLWLWCSPVFYLLQGFPAHIQRLCGLNIIVPFLNLYRSIFYEQVFFNVRDLCFSIIFSLLFFVYGYVFFIRRENFIRKYL